MNRITIAQIYVNSLRKKFDFLCEAIRENIGMLLVVGTKLDSSFSRAQFSTHAYSTPYHLDRNSNGGGIFLCVKEDSLLREDSLFREDSRLRF